MADKKSKLGNDTLFSLVFLIIPTIFVIIGIQFFTISYAREIQQYLIITLFTGLILLGVGAFIGKNRISHILKILGWIVFAFYWSTQPNTLYYGEEQDFVNAIICIIGVYVLFYVAYHEWLSLRRKEKVDCINWIAAASAIAGIIYFGIELSPIRSWLIEIVAYQSAQVLNFFIGNVQADGVNILCNGRYVLTIIFACTAVQSMVIFVGMIVPLPKVKIKRKIYGLLITVVPIYFLNLIRNALIGFLIKDDPSMFFTAHNLIGKGLSLIALIILLFIVIKFVPEVFDQINCLIDLPKRKGPIEQLFRGKK